MKRSIRRVDSWWLWQQPVPLKRAAFILADVQSDVFTLMHNRFSIDQQLRQWHFVISFPNEALLQVTGVA